MNSLYTIAVVDKITVLSKPVAYTLIGILLYFGLSDAFLIAVNSARPVHFNWPAMYFVYLSAFVVNPILMILGTKSSLFKLIALAWFEITMAVMLLFFTEVYGPFTALWSVMVLLAAIYDGWRGFVFSSLLLVTVATIYCLAYADELKPDFVGYATVTTSLIILTVTASYFFTYVLMNSRKKNHDLQILQRSETLQVNRLNTLINVFF